MTNTKGYGMYLNINSGEIVHAISCLFYFLRLLRREARLLRLFLCFDRPPVCPAGFWDGMKDANHADQVRGAGPGAVPEPVPGAVPVPEPGAGVDESIIK